MRFRTNVEELAVGVETVLSRLLGIDVLLLLIFLLLIELLLLIVRAASTLRGRLVLLLFLGFDGLDALLQEEVGLLHLLFLVTLLDLQRFNVILKFEDHLS